MEFETRLLQYDPQSEEVLPDGTQFTDLNKNEIIDIQFSKTANCCFMLDADGDLNRVALPSVSESVPTLVASPVDAIAVSPCGEELAYVIDGNLVVRSTSSHQEFCQIETNPPRHCEPNLIRFSDDGSMVLVALCDNIDVDQAWASLWDLRTGTLSASFYEERTLILGLSSVDGQPQPLIYRADRETQLPEPRLIETWNMVGNKNLISFEILGAEAIGEPLVSSNLDRVLIGHRVGKVAELFDGATGRRMAQYQVADLDRITSPTLAFSPNGNRVAICNVAKESRHGAFVLDAVTGDEIAFLQYGVNFEAWHCSFSQDGSLLVTSGSLSSNVGASIWETESGKKLANIQEHSEYVKFSLEGDLLVSGSAVTRIDID